VICNLPDTRASAAWAYTAGEGTVCVRPRANQAPFWEPTQAARERLQGTLVPRGKRLPDDEAFASMQRRGLVRSRTHEKKRLYSVRNIIKGTNVFGHSIYNVLNEDRAHQGILGTTERWGATGSIPTAIVVAQRPAAARVVLSFLRIFNIYLRFAQI
jgi:hypothetical protein